MGILLAVGFTGGRSTQILVVLPNLPMEKQQLDWDSLPTIIVKYPYPLKLVLTSQWRKLERDLEEMLI